MVIMASSPIHPSILAVRSRAVPAPQPLTAELVRQLALDAGADDAAIVSLDDPQLAEEKPHVLRAQPDAASLVSIVLRTHAPNIRSPQRSVANVEFHRAGGEVDAIAHRLAVALSSRGYPSMYPAMAFPMEMTEFPGRTWVVSHKRVAVAAQLGRMGLHRSVIHPRFGSFILLGTVITTARVDERPPALDFNPCIDCKLCVAACPVGAIEPSGGFRFSACLDHNYREFMTGFTDLLEEVADSKSRNDLRDRVPLADTVGRWQGLAFGPSYKAAYCIAVCPAGEDVLGPFLANRAGHLERVLDPLTRRVEEIHVVAGSDAERHVRKRFPHKQVRIMRSSLRPTSVRGFFAGLPLIFQRGPALGWRATFHFELTGTQAGIGSVTIDDGTLTVDPELVGTPDVTVRGDGQTWLDVVSKRRSPVAAVLRRRLRIQGDRSLLGKFAACFPR